jgi:GNAT superfamily N-acetyltransferase
MPREEPAKSRVVIVRVTGTPAPEQLSEIEAIFFAASGRTFSNRAERDAFRERWLGRYLAGGSDAVFLALARSGHTAGYLVGAVKDPASQARFDDIAYFRGDFRELTRRFPAHLHINLAAEFRNQGIGARLIEAFAQHAMQSGAQGVHVVTGKAMRNRRFYERCGFSERATTRFNGNEVVFLGRELALPLRAQ